MKKIAIIMGSDSDLPVLEGAIKTLNQFDVPCEVRVLSAHRTPIEAADFARSAREKGFGAIIAAAGKAAHLAGAMAAGTTLPVIGIPVKSSTLDGLDALLSTVQMPSGMPVATVAIDGAVNPPCWPSRFWLCPMRHWPKSWLPTARRHPTRSWPRIRRFPNSTVPNKRR